MKLIPLLGCAALLSVAAAFADTPSASVTASPPPTAQVKPLTAQQKRMQSCNAEASKRQLKGAEHQTFMQSCLSGKSAAAPASTSQERMKSCNAKANAEKLKGDERKAFMSTCLKAD